MIRFFSKTNYSEGKCQAAMNGMKRSVIIMLFFFVVAMPIKQLFGQESISEKAIPVKQSAVAIQKLTLDECIALALKNNAGLQIEREKIVELEHDYRVAASALYPKLFFSAYYQRVDEDRLGVPSNMLYSEETLAQAKLKQILFDGGKAWNNRSAAIRAEDAQKESAEATRLDTIFAVSQSYYRVLEAREILRVSETSREQRAAFFTLTEAFYKAGRATRLEFLKAEAQLLDAERSVSLSREAFRLSELILKKVIAIDLGTDIEITNSFPEELPDPPGEDLLMQEAFAKNPDLKKMFLVKEQSEASLRAAQGLFWPEVSLQGTYGYRERDTASRDSEWTAGVFLEWSLFEGGLTRAQVGKARSKVNQLTWTEKALRDQVQVDLREALGILRTSIAAVKSSRRLLEAQEEAYQAALAFYTRGKSTYIEVLGAQVDLTQAKAALIRALGDYQNARAKLDRVTGKKAT
jgi:outer membrane protein